MREEFKITEEIKDFTKDMLEDLMVVKCRNGNTYIKFGSKLLRENGVYFLDNYDKNLLDICNENLDIIKIYKINELYGVLGLEDFTREYKNSLELIWERKEEPIVEYTLDELEQKLGQKIKIVNNK